MSEQIGPRWRLILGKMFLGVALTVNNLFGGGLGGQIFKPEEINPSTAAGAPADDPSRDTPDNSDTTFHQKP